MVTLVQRFRLRFRAQITSPRPTDILQTALWDEMFIPQADNWINNGVPAPALKNTFGRLLDLAREAAASSEVIMFRTFMNRFEL